MLLLQMKKPAWELTLQIFIGDQICFSKTTYPYINSTNVWFGKYLTILGFSCFRRNHELVERLSKPSRNAKELSFPTKYSQSSFEQFITCLWKQNLSYWRNPQYTAVRFFYTVIISLMFGTICWKFGNKRFFLSLSLFIHLTISFLYHV